MILHNINKFFISLLFLMSLNNSFSFQLDYKYDVNSKYKAEAIITGKQILNGDFITDYKQYYKVITTVLNLNENGLAEIQDDGYYYIDNNTDDQVKEINSNIITKYFKDKRGVTFAPTNIPFPVMRNIPYLTNENIIPGSKWEFDGTEVQELFHDKVISIFPVSVQYEFIKMSKTTDDIAEINYNILVDVDNDFSGTIDKRVLSVSGISNVKLFFNVKSGTPSKEIYDRHYQFYIHNKNIGTNVLYEFMDNGERVWTLIEKIPENVMDSLKEETKDIDDVNITQDEKGIKLSLEDIEFLPDSATLTKTESLRLDKIAKIIEKYKEKQTLIIGHTTNRGSESGRQKLSVDRARSVTDYLINKGAIKKDNAQIMGKGGTEPVVPNTTPEGLRKNRRVEIYLLEE